MSIVGPLLPALVPLTTLLWLRAADHSVSISRGTWDMEYDYIIGELTSPTEAAQANRARDLAGATSRLSGADNLGAPVPLRGNRQPTWSI